MHRSIMETSLPLMARDIARDRMNEDYSHSNFSVNLLMGAFIKGGKDVLVPECSSLVCLSDSSFIRQTLAIKHLSMS